MKANELKFEKFLSSGDTQFVIPVYQRNYDWEQKHCERLLEDILEVAKDDKRNAHFIGSIVYVHDDVYSVGNSITELVIIDGQQRITTLTLIYLRLYQLALELKDDRLAAKIRESFLINKFADDNAKLKLRPTENNDKALKYLLNDEKIDHYSEDSRLIENFQYFKQKITKENYEHVLKGLLKLMFVDIALDRQNDNPQRIFESLNSTGLDLSQADLIRNYILMGLKREDQTRFYQKYWEPIEALAKDEAAKENKVSDFVRDYLTLKNSRISKKGSVYEEFKKKFPTTTAAEFEPILAEIKELAVYYHKLLNPNSETDREIQRQLNYINRLDITVTYPFLMQVYEDYGTKIIDKKTFLDILQLVESYTWRRTIVGLPTNALNKVFMSLYDKVDKSNYLDSVQHALLNRATGERFPHNQEVAEALKIKDVYSTTKDRLYFLERLENYGNTEYVTVKGNPDITIEHIFPQHPDERWETELGKEEENKIKETFLNTIGNLTLSGNNGKLSNKYFTEKRNLPEVGYRASRLWLNKYLANLDKWDTEEIEKRCQILTERFFQIWKYPEIELLPKEPEREMNIFEVGDPSRKKIEYVTFRSERLSFKKGTIKHKWLYLAVVKKLFEEYPDRFLNSSLKKQLHITTEPIMGETTSLSEPIGQGWFIKTIGNSLALFKWLKMVLTEFGLQDALRIKFRD